MEPEAYLFRLPGGSPIYRRDIQRLLQEAALACNIPKHLVGSHSQRCGGATALYAAGYSIEYIKRFGRWKSDCVHIYLWEGRPAAEGVVAAMTTNPYAPNTDAYGEWRRSAMAQMTAAAAARRPPRP